MAASARPKPVHLNVTACRYSNYDTPFWARENTLAGRWHVPGDGPTQYLSLSVEGAWAELIRAEDLRSEEQVSQVRMSIWQVAVDQQLVVDYSDFAKAEQAGFKPEHLVSEDYRACQREGKRLRQLGHQGVLAPSAALVEATNLTLFGPRIAVAWDTEPYLAAMVPAAVLVRGAPPQGLVGRVRHFGKPHAGIRRYRMSRRGA